MILWTADVRGTYIELSNYVEKYTTSDISRLFPLYISRGICRYFLLVVAMKDTIGGLSTMCGIVGYIGQQDAKEILLKGLEKLEYRGYDSAGIAVRDAEGVAPKKKGVLQIYVKR